MFWSLVLALVLIQSWKPAVELLETRDSPLLGREERQEEVTCLPGYFNMFKLRWGDSVPGLGLVVTVEISGVRFPRKAHPGKCASVSQHGVSPGSRCTALASLPTRLYPVRLRQPHLVPMGRASIEGPSASMFSVSMEAIPLGHLWRPHSISTAHRLSASSKTGPRVRSGDSRGDRSWPADRTVPALAGLLAQDGADRSQSCE